MQLTIQQQYAMPRFFSESVFSDEFAAPQNHGRNIVVYANNDEYTAALSANTVSDGVVLADNTYYYKDSAGGSSLPVKINASHVDAAKKMAPQKTGPFTSITEQHVPEPIQEGVINIAALSMLDYTVERDRLLSCERQSVKQGVSRWTGKKLEHVATPNALFDATCAVWTYDASAQCWSADVASSLHSVIMRKLLANQQLVAKHGRFYTWPDNDAEKVLCSRTLQQEYYYSVVLPQMLVKKMNEIDTPTSADWRACEKLLRKAVAQWTKRTTKRSNDSGLLFGPPTKMPACVKHAAAIMQNKQRMQLSAMYVALRSMIPGGYSATLFYNALELERNASKVMSRKQFKSLLVRDPKSGRKFRTYNCSQIQFGNTEFTCPYANGEVGCARNLGLHTAGRTPPEMAALTGNPLMLLKK